MLPALGTYRMERNPPIPTMPVISEPGVTNHRPKL
jgi:hypothetical protein